MLYLVYLTKEMPCGCKVPTENYPENAEWGPLFWKLLHGLAHHSGKQKGILLQNDEIRNWISILTKIQPCIPCDICRDHYGRWLKDNPVSELEKIPYTAVGPWIRTWLWKLHNEINEGNDKPIFSESSLAEVYKDTNTVVAWKALEPVIKLAISLNGLPFLPWKKWLSYVRVLQGIYGL